MRKSETRSAALDEVVVSLSEEFSPRFNRPTVELDVRPPRGASDDLFEDADVVVTLGCDEACPVLPGRRYEAWELPVVSRGDLEGLRALRDAVAARVDEMLDSMKSSD